MLIREIIDGKPYYYKGYQEVLAGNVNEEGVMGCSSLQSFIVAYLVRVLLRSIDEDRYLIASNEPGLHIDKKNNLSSDILVFDYNVLTIDEINLRYAQVPPIISVEVDTRIELENVAESKYVAMKTMKLLNFGVKKVIWFFTETKQIMIATPGNWATFGWDYEVALMPGALCNVGQYLRSKGSKYA